MRSRLSAFRSTIDRATITRYVKLSLSLSVSIATGKQITTAREISVHGTRRTPILATTYLSACHRFVITVDTVFSIPAAHTCRCSHEWWHNVRDRYRPAHTSMPANFDTDSRRDNIEISDLTELSWWKIETRIRPSISSIERAAKREKLFFTSSILEAWKVSRRFYRESEVTRFSGGALVWYRGGISSLSLFLSLDEALVPRSRRWYRTAIRMNTEESISVQIGVTDTEARFTIQIRIGGPLKS